MAKIEELKEYHRLWLRALNEFPERREQYLEVNKKIEQDIKKYEPGGKTIEIKTT
jgi:hypothetical protein